MPPMRLNGLGEEVEEVAALQLATADNSHDALDIARAAVGLRAAADLAPDDEAAQCALGMVIGRFHARRVDEGPQRGVQIQNMPAGARCLGVAADRSLAQQRLDAMAQKQHVASEHVAFPCAIAHSIPEGEHALRERDQFIADASRPATALGHLGEVAQQMRPAQLPALCLDPGIGVIAVRHQDAGKLCAQCRLGRLLAEEVLKLFGVLYAVERQAQELEANQRRQIRQQQARPAADALHAWLLAQRQRVPDGSATAKAIEYSLVRWKALTHYVDDGNVPIDNNWVENRIRSITIGRNNWPARRGHHEPDPIGQAEQA